MGYCKLLDERYYFVSWKKESCFHKKSGKGRSYLRDRDINYFYHYKIICFKLFAWESVLQCTFLSKKSKA